MRRSDREISFAKRRWRENRRFHEKFDNELSPRAVTLISLGQSPVGRFRKRDAYDCGITRCLLCHGDKFPRRLPTFQERIARLKLSEGLAELES